MSYRTQVSFTVGGNEYSGFSLDIGAGGIFIKTDEPFTIGEPIVLSIPLRDGAMVMNYEGAIARIAEDGIGVTRHPAVVAPMQEDATPEPRHQRQLEDTPVSGRSRRLPVPFGQPTQTPAVA